MSIFKGLINNIQTRPFGQAVGIVRAKSLKKDFN